MGITDRGMQAAATTEDQWLIEPGPKGAGRFVGRITPAGERLFYYRYTDTQGKRDRLRIGVYDPKGRDGLKVADARAMAVGWSKLYQAGARDLRRFLADRDAEAAAAKAAENARVDAAKIEAAQRELAARLAEEQRISVKRLFERWAETELKPHIRTDGKRTGRKDAGQYTLDQFERRIFPVLGAMAAADVRKADILAILDVVRAEGKLRTCNVLLADLKQMFRFAAEREIIPHSPIESIKKRQAGGADTERSRVLTVDEIQELFLAMPAAKLSKRSELAISVILATGCRLGELMTAEWEHVSTEASTWHLPDTKNQRPHTIHLSAFASAQFKALAALREKDENGVPLPWIFPSALGKGPVDIKSFGKQLADRQRPPDLRLNGRSKATSSLSLSGGRWTAHDLRRTAATLMASLGVSSDVIDECLNHMIQSRVTRVYIRDRREAQQALAFDALGAKLSEIVQAAGCPST